MNFSITEVLIFFTVTFLSAILWQNRRFLYLAAKIPNIKFSYIKNLRKNIDNRGVFNLIYEHVWQVKDLAKIWFGPHFFVIVASPECAKVVMNKCLDKAWMVDFLKMEKSILFGSGELWYTHRKIMSPFFGVNTIKNLIPMFERNTQVLLDNVNEMSEKGEFDVFNYMAALTLETILKAMELDIDLQNQKHETRDVAIENLEIMAKAITKRGLLFWFHNDSVYKHTSIYRRETIAREKWKGGLAEKVMKKIRNSWSDEEKPKNFIRALMSPKFGLCDKEIEDTIYSMNLAAQDTSAIVISTTLLMLAMHKDIQQKVLDEILETTHSASLDYATLSSLKYLENVLNEVMRLFPVVPFAFRKTQEEVELENGMTIPSNTNLFIPIIHIQRNPLYWGDDSHSFNPDRFEKENFEKIHPYAFMPFTKGPRMCLGWRYAMMLLKMVIANFILRFEVDTTKKFNEIELQLGCTLTIYKGYRISVRERKLK